MFRAPHVRCAQSCAMPWCDMLLSMELVSNAQRLVTKTDCAIHICKPQDAGRPTAEDSGCCWESTVDANNASEKAPPHRGCWSATNPFPSRKAGMTHLTRLLALLAPQCSARPRRPSAVASSSTDTLALGSATAILASAHRLDT